MNIADRMRLIGTETAFKVLSQVSSFPPERRKHVISFGLGEPDFNTPEHIKQAGIKSIQDNHTHYVPSAGIPELREEVAKFASKVRNINITPDMITIMSAGKITIGLGILTCMNPGDEVIYPNPGYPIYESMIRTFGGKPIPAYLKERNNWNYNIDQLRSLITDRTKMIVLNSPQNPTGGVLSIENLNAISEICLERDLWVLTDEIYSEFVYDSQFKFHSIAEIAGMQERTIILDGFSKFFAMTGWRLGYAIANPEISRYLANWCTNFTSCAPHFVQDAGLVAMREDKAPSLEMIKTFKERRDLICDLLNSIPGISVKKPRGAFYLFANVTKACRNLGLKNALAFQDFLLEKANVVVLSQEFFGTPDPTEKDQFVRFSYCVSTENIINGCNRIKAAIEGKQIDYAAESKPK
jgi:aspartate aminotransferase